MKTINIIAGVLAVIASAAGIAFELYREIPWLATQMKGQDAVTIIAAAILIIAAVKRGQKMRITAAGINAYMIYTYLFYALEVKLNPLFHVYLVITVLSLISMIMILSDLKRPNVTSVKTGGRVLAIIYLGTVATVLAVLWNADMISNLAGQPLLANPTGQPIKIVWVFDLSFVIPAVVYTIYLLKTGKPFGIPLCGVVLVKASSMGAALLGMTVGMGLGGFELQAGLAAFWTLLTAGGITSLIIFLRSASIEE